MTRKFITKREKTILYLTIAVFVFALCFNFIVAPVIAKNSLLNKELLVAKTKLTKYLWLISQKQSIQNKYKAFTTTVKLADKSKDAQVTALTELEELAKAANVRIVDIRPQNAIQRGKDELLIEVRLEGTMEGYLKFIYNIENSLSFLEIKKFQLNAKTNSQILEGTFLVAKPSALD